MKTLLLAAAAAVTLAALPAHALSVTSTAYTYSQDFDGLASTGAGLSFTLPGWNLYSTNSATPVSTYSTSTGSSGTTSGFYSFGTNSDRALGSIITNAFAGTSGSGNVSMVLALTNDSGVALSELGVRYDGEQWRNQSAAVQTLKLQVGFGSSYSAVAFSDTGFDFASPMVGGTATLLDGNLAANRVVGIGGNFDTSASWAPGSTLWLRWFDLNDVGNDQLLAIDNISLSVTAVPEPETYALLLAGLGALGLLARRRGATASRR